MSAPFCSRCRGPPTTFALLLDPSPTLSALKHLLTSNDAPPESQIPVIRNAVSDFQDQSRVLDAQIDALGAHIADLKATLAQLVRRCDGTADQIYQHQAILSPVRRIPPELICEIYAWTWASCKSDYSRHEPPWFLGQICRSWRHFALSYSPLWNSITVPAFINSRVLSGIQAQLLRSTNAPLNIHWLDAKRNVDSGLLDLILPHCDRWRSLRLSPPFAQEDPNLDWLHLASRRLDRLETLEASHVIIPDVLTYAPNLRRVILTNWSFTTPSPAIAIPWGQITHYRGRYTRERQLEILGAALNLVECSIAIEGEDPFDPHAPSVVLPHAPSVVLPHAPPVVLPHLRRLDIQNEDVLLYLTAPSLEELRTPFLRTPFDRPPVLPRFVHHSVSMLKKLVLMPCTICAELIDLLRGLPTVTHLLIEPDSRSWQLKQHDALFNALVVSDPPPRCLCPNLTVLVYGISGDREFRDSMALDLLFGMARCRLEWNSGSSLTTLRLYYYDGSYWADPSKTWRRVQRLRDDGFDARVLNRAEVELFTQKKADYFTFDRR